MTDNEIILNDLIDKIRLIIGKYGEQQFYIAYSGGRDSTALSALIDLALPENTIPRVYADTGIELQMIRDYVYNKAATDSRITIIKPTTPIKQMLERDGYPFKSKTHAKNVDRFQRLGRCDSVVQYLGEREDKKPWAAITTCPKVLRYQFEKEFTLHLSDKCCVRLKEEPLENWSAENKRPIALIGIMREEGGRRSAAKCLSYRNKRLKAFQPLVPISKDWEEWFINEYKVELCAIYSEPYNFARTGCKGCPFAVNLQKELDTLEKYFPAERKQCEAIWKPVYAEYRRLGYRLKERR